MCGKNLSTGGESQMVRQVALKIKNEKKHFRRFFSSFLRERHKSEFHSFIPPSPPAVELLSCCTHTNKVGCFRAQHAWRRHPVIIIGVRRVLHLNKNKTMDWLCVYVSKEEEEEKTQAPPPVFGGGWTRGKLTVSDTTERKRKKKGNFLRATPSMDFYFLRRENEEEYTHYTFSND